MLAQMRNASKGWVAGILIFLLVAAFAIWGVEDVFLSRPSDTVAKVGGVKISNREFLEAFDRVRERFGQQSQRNIQREEALQFGFDRVALNQLISGELLDQEADRLGLVISDKALVSSIQQIESFAGPDGKFDAAAYKAILTDNNITTKRYERDVRSAMKTDQLVDSVLAGIDPPVGFAQAFYDFGDQRRKVSYLAVPLKAAGDVAEPSEEDLKTLYADNKERFTAPEYRTFSYFLLSPESLADRVTVPEEDITALYNFHKEKYIVPEKRKVRQILFDTKEEADAAYQRLKAGEDFIKIANERGFSGNDTDLGTVTQAAMVDEKFGQAAFGLEKSGITEPVQGGFGFAILKVENITPGSERKIGEVREELVAERAKEMAKNLVFEMMREIEDSRAGGQSLEDIAAAKNITLHKAQSVNRRGLTGAGTPPEGPGTIPLAVLAQAFDSEINDDNDFAETTSGSGTWFVTSLTDITPSALKPYEEVRADVIALWQELGRREALVKYGAELAEKARAGEALETLARSFGGRVITPVDPITRRATDDHLTPALVTEAFRTPKGGIIDGLGQGETSYVIAQINEVVQAPQDQKLFAIASIGESLERALQQDISEHFIVTLEQRAGVTRNARAIDAALGRTSQSGR